MERERVNISPIRAPTPEISTDGEVSDSDSPDIRIKSLVIAKHNRSDPSSSDSETERKTNRGEWKNEKQKLHENKVEDYRDYHESDNEKETRTKKTDADGNRLDRHGNVIKSVIDRDHAVESAPDNGDRRNECRGYDKRRSHRSSDDESRQRKRQRRDDMHHGRDSRDYQHQYRDEDKENRNRYNDNRSHKRHHKYEDEKNVDEAQKQKLADEEYLKAKRKQKIEEGGDIMTKTGGAYIPPARLRAMQAKITNKASQEYQRIAWEALKKSINGLINKVNISNIEAIVRELYQENLVRGRGHLVRAIITAQQASPTFTHVYAALVAIINTQFPNNGELILKRVILNFRRSYKRNDKPKCLTSAQFIAHLVNQNVAHEIVALEILMLLLENTTDDSVEIAVAILKECGQKLTEISPSGVNAVFEQLRKILHEQQMELRVQNMIEVIMAIRKDSFKDHPIVVPELDLVEEEDQITHLINLDEKIDGQEILNIFKFDPTYEEAEAKYKAIIADVLSSSDDESGSEGSSGADDSDSEGDETEQQIIDKTETNLVALRRIIYLTIQSSLDFEECAHKMLKIQLKPGQEVELCNMILDCCAQQRTYEKLFGLLGARFCMIDRKYIEPFQQLFCEQYDTCHRLEINKLRNVSRFFGHLLHSDAISWEVISHIHLNEEETTSSGRVYIKFLFQELSEYMGVLKLNKRLQDPTIQSFFEGIFPRDNPANTRFAINFFTSIGLGGLTDELRAHLTQSTKAMVQKQAEEAAHAAESSSSSSSSGSSDSSSSDSSSSDSGSSDSGSSSDSSDSDSSENEKKRKKKTAKELTRKRHERSNRNRDRSYEHDGRKEKHDHRKQHRKQGERNKDRPEHQSSTEWHEHRRHKGDASRRNHSDDHHKSRHLDKKDQRQQQPRDYSSKRQPDHHGNSYQDDQQKHQASRHHRDQEHEDRRSRRDDKRHKRGRSTDGVEHREETTYEEECKKQQKREEIRKLEKQIEQIRLLKEQRKQKQKKQALHAHQSSKDSSSSERENSRRQAQKRDSSSSSSEEVMHHRHRGDRRSSRQNGRSSYVKQSQRVEHHNDRQSRIDSWQPSHRDIKREPSSSSDGTSSHGHKHRHRGQQQQPRGSRRPDNAHAHRRHDSSSSPDERQQNKNNEVPMSKSGRHARRDASAQSHRSGSKSQRGHRSGISPSYDIHRVKHERMSVDRSAHHDRESPVEYIKEERVSPDLRRVKREPHNPTGQTGTRYLHSADVATKWHDDSDSEDERSQPTHAKYLKSKKAVKKAGPPPSDSSSNSDSSSSSSDSSDDDSSSVASNSDDVTDVKLSKVKHSMQEERSRSKMRGSGDGNSYRYRSHITNGDSDRHLKTRDRLRSVEDRGSYSHKKNDRRSGNDGYRRDSRRRR